MTHPSVQNALDYLLAYGEAVQATVPWGKGYRNVIITQGKKYQYKLNKNINKNLRNKIVPLYIRLTMSSNKKTLIIDDIIAPDDDDDDDDKYGVKQKLNKPARRLRTKTSAKIIQNWVKKNRANFEQANKMVDVTVSITFVNPSSGNSYEQNYTIPMFVL